jgi:chemotaxis protein MotD
MEMHLGIDKDADNGGKSNVETVTILDSRRYIGLATNTNSASVTAAISGDSDWAHAMHASSSLSNAAEQSSTGKVVNTLKIQMNPIELGLVTATLRLQGDALNVDLKVETAAAFRQLKEDHNKMLESLRSQGYAVDSVTISMAPTASSDAGSQSGAQSDSRQGFAQSQGGEARERQNQSGQRSAGGFDVTGESDVASASSGATGGSGTGDVYL